MLCILLRLLVVVVMALAEEDFGSDEGDHRVHCALELEKC